MAALARPPRPRPANSLAPYFTQVGVILTHGASGDLRSGNLPAFAASLAGTGVPCVRFTFKTVNLAARAAAYKVRERTRAPCTCCGGPGGTDP